MNFVKLKSVYFIIALALVAVVANSCRKDVHPSEPQVAPEQLKDAKSWYQANYPFKETGQGKKVNEANDGEIDFSQLIHMLLAQTD
ncbi:MAG: hypothetical protein EOP46_06550 [Sphingobacteriaceae bacterium]|nr:MAG: hypothetical protein EOP46_06550 [Sphingobacteriaceae bacterium]